MTLAELIASDPNLSLINQALINSGLIKEISGKGPYTVFVPTNEALEKEFSNPSLGVTKEQFLNDLQNLKHIGQYHIVENKSITSRQVREDMSVETKSGEIIDLSYENDIFRAGGATVIGRDKLADNGVLHIIDKVLMPVKALA